MAWRCASICAFAWLAAASQGADAVPPCPQPLVVGFKDSASPPGLYGSGTRFADPPGWEVEAVQDALGRLGCTAELVRLPIRRVLPALAQDQVQLAMLYAYTPERQRSVRFPLDARGEPDLAWAPAFGNISLFGLPGSRPPPDWDGQRLPPGTRVGILDGSVQEFDTRQRGWEAVPIARPDDGVAMLHGGRFDVLMVPRELLSATQRDALAEWKPAVGRQAYFVPASPALVQRHPAWTLAFWQEFCRASKRRLADLRPTACGVKPPAPRP